MKKEKEWYNSASIVTNFLIGLIAVIILLSQSFAVKNGLSAYSIFTNIINHNIIYVMVLIYFVFLKTKIGKKYFNYLNVFITTVYSIFTITSFLSVFQNVSIDTMLSLAIKCLLLLYLIHSMFRDSSYWKELGIYKSPFNEFDNDWYFYGISFMSVLLLCISLIETGNFDGSVLSMLDCCYYLLFARYIYLYRDYVDNKKKVVVKVDKEIAEKIEEVKEVVEDAVEEVKDTAKKTVKKIKEVGEDK